MIAVFIKFSTHSQHISIDNIHVVPPPDRAHSMVRGNFDINTREFSDADLAILELQGALRDGDEELVADPEEIAELLADKKSKV